ncbi:hypothetical protein EG68_01495 [Paragonimus skrjabini miyazakii]|uniref:RING-CH-type domain-containing protein n=1 Tax=Paragonimus skrjabini miyazakii TaxID=59628 RepID=A0A8S9Z1P9_9TREM|nr:hypothetical protein EG68_01495 [Paragonimus skrjabini miyazakii]
MDGPSLPQVHGTRNMASIVTESSIPGSPFQSTSHPTGLSREGNSPHRFKGLKTALRKKSRGNDSLNSESPDNAYLHPLLDRVPNAPKPSLQVNEETVLFGNNRRLSRNALVKKFHTDHENTDLLPTFAANVTNEEGVDIKTSTPFVRKNSKQQTHEVMLSSALIGAPRLALNVSVRDASSFNDLTEPGCVTPQANSPPKVDLELSGLSNDGSKVQNCSGINHLSPIQTATTIPQVNKAAQMNTDSTNVNDITYNGFRCRICLDEGDLEGALFSPCRCKGTVGLVHRQCLQRWLYESGKPNCELCGYAYIMTPSRRRSLPNHSAFPVANTGVDSPHTALREWFSSNATRRHLLTDLICLVLLTPSTYIGVYFCVVGAIGFSIENPYAWQVFGLWCLAILLVVLLTAWMVLATRHHVSNFQRYRLYQRQRRREEAERMANLPRWRFSIQPRPRGSSVFLHSTNEHTEPPSAGNSSIIDPQQVSSPGSLTRSTVSELEVQAHILPTTSIERSNIVSPKLVVSVALSAVPEVTEEFSNPTTSVGTPEAV